jgi:CBS domain-containing protein
MAVRASDAMIPSHYDIHPDHPLTEAIERMRRDRTEVLPVVDGDEMIGLLTLADASGDTTVWDIDPAKAAVRDVMQAEFVWCYEDEQLDRAAASLRDAGQKHGVVLNRDHELVGLIGADRLEDAASNSSPTAEHASSTAGRAAGSADAGRGQRSDYSVRPRVRPRTATHT